MIYCKFCKSEQTFTFTEDNIKFVQCCSCGNKERMKNYFKTSARGFTQLME